jgi:hypothetical protein
LSINLKGVGYAALRDKFSLLRINSGSFTLKVRNMKPSDEIIEKFQRIYFEEYGEQLSKEEAYDNFMSLVDLLRIILRPVKKQSQDSEKPGPVSSMH